MTQLYDSKRVFSRLIFLPEMPIDPSSRYVWFTPSAVGTFGGVKYNAPPTGGIRTHTSHPSPAGELLLMVRKSGVHQLRLVVYPTIFIYFQGFIHPRWCKIYSINSMVPSFLAKRSQPESQGLPLSFLLHF